MKSTGILAAIAAALLLGSKSGGGVPTGAQPLVDTNPTPTPTPTPTPSPDVGSQDFTEQFGFSPSFKIFEPSPAGEISEGVSILRPLAEIITTTPAASAPEIPLAISKPVQPTTRSWRWYTPGGIVESREPTEEEKESGTGCPEVPGIWDMQKYSSSQLRYCANPDCPSRSKTWDSGSGEWIENSPAILEQQTDNAGTVSYFCRVCRSVQ